MLLLGFVVFILHASIFCFRFSQKKVQTSQKILSVNGYLLKRKAHAKIKKRKKKKRTSFCTKPFNHSK